jgi:cell filamentation protein
MEKDGDRAMKSSRMQACIDYIRFNQEVEGFSLEEPEESILREVLDDERTADDAVEALVEELHLPSEYVPMKGMSIPVPGV